MSVVGEIHRFEPGTSRDAPTVLALHGTGGNEDDLVPLARRVAPGAAILSPRGPVLEHGMPRFFRRLDIGVFDLEDLAQRTQELAAFIRSSSATYGFDPARVYALGYSNGANIAASLLLTDGGLLAGAALLRAMLPFEPKTLPELAGKPIMMAAGRRDHYMTPEQAESLADLLRRAGGRVELVWNPGGHDLAAEELTTVTAWFAREVGA